VTRVDIVVVSYNSRDSLRACVEHLASVHDVVVADNASTDGCLETVVQLPVTVVELGANRGFAAGCNAGWRAGRNPHVLFVNPDAVIDDRSVGALAHVLDTSPEVGAVSPRILEPDGSLAYSQRRFPRLRATYSRALFLHRLWPRASWTDELVRDSEAYERPGSPEWVSGACVLVRRELLEELGGWDDGFFMYCEDKDLCRRLRQRGYDIRFEPSAVARHEGGASAPRASLLPVLATSRLRYARKHSSRAKVEVERLGLALSAVTHMALTRRGRATRLGYARSLRVLLSPGTGAAR
jgi:GT2 family glycosyltransferase